VPPPPVPPEVDALLARPNPAVIASVRRDGSPHTVATWYGWEDGRLLLTMDESRLRLRFLRRDPHVAVTVLDGDDWGRHVSLLGRVVSLEEDRDLEATDRLAVHYSGRPFRRRDRRRYRAWVEVDAWHGWEGSEAWPRPRGSSQEERG
jgi:PPOX class probable F420-dependent enzyme